MKITAALALTLAALAGSVAAQDAAKGERVFRQCRVCHQITAPDGSVIFKGGANGPDLYGVVGRRIASVPGFRYGPDILRLADAYPDAVWDVQSLAAYLADPTAYLRLHLDDPKAKSGMTFKLRRDQADLVAYLLAHSPDAGPQPEQGDGAPRP